MPVVQRVLAACAATLVCVATAAFPAHADSDIASRLDAAIEQTMARFDIPGAIVGLSIPGKLDYVRAVGVSDMSTGVAMDVDDHTRIGSITKTFTGTAVLQLVDQGRIKLSDPISRYVDGVPSGDIITLDMLGRMRSGLFDYTADTTLQHRLFAEAPTGPDAFSLTPAELLGYAFGHPLNFDPGTRFEYCNTNFVLLGLVVEKVSGMALADYFTQNIFGPLALGQTSYPGDSFIPEPFTHGYTSLPDGAVTDATFWNPSWGDAAGKAISNYADMKIWAAAVGRGATLTPSTQAQRVEVDGTSPGFGYGFAIFDVNGWIGHNGEIPGYTNVSIYLPQLDATLVVFANSDADGHPPAGDLATAVTRIATPDHVYKLG